MKKGWLGLLSLASLVPFVSAESVATDWGKTAAGGIVSFLDTLKLNPTALSTILLGILLWIVVYSIVSKISGYKGHWSTIGSGFFSLIVVILSFIYLPSNFVESIVHQYGAMGAAILTVIPFIIILYFSISISQSLFIARVTWVFYISYYLAIFIYQIATLPANSGWGEYVPYLGAIVAGLIIFFALTFIRNLVFKGELDAKEEKAIKGVRFRQLGRKIITEETKSLVDEE